ncbi:MAG: hypothetical protein LBO69_02375 [Ignavibacteria bacterium]|jgi:hypothetical protein|nr:hypothetical protein [Ignavibacteria bacterium]
MQNNTTNTLSTTIDWGQYAERWENWQKQIAEAILEIAKEVDPTITIRPKAAQIFLENNDYKAFMMHKFKLHINNGCSPEAYVAGGYLSKDEQAKILDIMANNGLERGEVTKPADEHQIKIMLDSNVVIKRDALKEILKIAFRK